MNYKLVLKDPKKQPAGGVYTDWKEIISEECYRQCVYCCIHERQWGGVDHYHIDHFRPKSIAKFKHLENDLRNLFYACPVCNRFKSDDWPADPDLASASYPDPSVTNYNDIFDFDWANYSVVGKCVSANYLIARLYLNRPQLVYERRETALEQKEFELFIEVSKLAAQVQDAALVTKSFTVIANLRKHLLDRRKIRPYKLAEIRK